MGLSQTRAYAGSHFIAIYSLNHKSIGKATQDKAFTAAAHIRYITRDAACREVLGNRMPLDPKKARQWIQKEEREDRKNARICDKVMIALPRELSQDQRTELVRDFGERITQGRAPWVAAIHDKGKDRQNPHCHMVLRDRDTKTGKRCLHMSAGKAERAFLKEKGIDAMTTERMRVLWERASNEHLERAGSKERIDCRTLEAQGLKREPTIHEGVQARQMTARGETPQSKVVAFSNNPTARSKQRSVDYAAIDGGKTRQEHNAEIINLEQKKVQLVRENKLMNRDEKRFVKKAGKGDKPLVDDYKRMAAEKEKADEIWLTQQLKIRQNKNAERDRQKELNQGKKRGFSLGD